MKRVDSIEAFIADRFGSYVVGRHYIAWCSDPRLGGVVFFGTPDDTDARELDRIMSLPIDPARDEAYDVVNDGRRVERILKSAFEIYAKTSARRIREQQPLLRRAAVIVPAGIIGTVMAGFFHVFNVVGKQGVFSDAGEAFGWIGRADALAELDAVIERELGESPVVTQLRLWLATHLDGVTVTDAARALERSSRTLQRELGLAATSFRREVERARVAAARARLADSDVKIEAIAREVGCLSVASFAKLFRRVTGESPSEFRARARPAEGRA